MSPASGTANVVLVHDGFVDGSGWLGVYNALKHRGHHATVVQNPTISLADDVAVTRRAIASLQGPVILVGHSMGGLLAASVALARPERVQALVLVAPAGYRVGFWGLADSFPTDKAGRIGRYLGLRAFITPIHDPSWLKEPDSASAYDLTMDTAYQRVVSTVLEEFDFEGIGAGFSQITQPTLLIWGTLDPVIPPAIGDTIQGLIPCNRLVVIPRTYHRPHAERPDTVLYELRRFLKSPGCG